jgi:hypothetical protein
VSITISAKAKALLKFQSVEEEQDQFFALFPHRFDFIYAEYPELGRSPDWQTERRYPLSNRIFRQGDYLFGVRFGSQTQYCLLDIDRGSAYHPQQDALAISRLAAALESMGLVAYVACTSSYSGGLHLYFPLAESQNSWELATVVTAQLTAAGFLVKPGQLEVFPNPKLYVTEGHPSLFNAHRLPMQIGSYLLNQDFQPVWSDQSRFVEQWVFAQRRNLLDRKILKHFLKQVKRTQFRVSGKADKFIADLNAEIEAGWSGSGQTNRLLGRITLRTYVFHHVISGGTPLEGKALIDEIVRVARSLPGYRDHCNHQREIEQRAEEWARCIQNSKYFPYGTLKGKYKEKQEEAIADLTLDLPNLPGWNQQQSQSARDRICRAIADLLEKNSLPIGATARFHALTAYRIGGGSLYRHRDLWHPSDFASDELVSSDSAGSNFAGSHFASFAAEINQPVENPPDPPTEYKPEAFDRDEVASNVHSLTSLLSRAGGNSSVSQELSDRQHLKPPTGGNASVPLESRRQQYLESGDPILVAEALTWVQPAPLAEARPVEPAQTLQVMQPQVLQPQVLQPQLMVRSPHDLTYDLSDTLAALSALTRWLGWNRVQVRENLLELFDKGDRALLLEGELHQWLEWLTLRAEEQQALALLELD